MPPQEGEYYYDPTKGTQYRKYPKGGYKTQEELDREKLMQEFLTERGWAGIGGVRKRPPKDELEKQFGEWKKRRLTSRVTKASEQAAALKGEEK